MKYVRNTAKPATHLRVTRADITRHPEGPALLVNCLELPENTYFLGSAYVVSDSDLESACEKFLQRGGPGNFACLACGKTSTSYSKARNHFEAKHYTSGGYTCQLCNAFCKTRHGLECHRSRSHPSRN